MKRLSETSVQNFERTPHTEFMLSVIDSLANHNHVSIEEIDAADKKFGLVWNWLNSAAKSFSVEKILNVLKKLNLLEHGESLDTDMIMNESSFDEIRAAKAKERKSQKELLLQIQSISLDSITEKILEKIPSAKWHPFKNGTYYTGKVSLETNTGLAELWYRTDGMIVASVNNGPKHQCYTEEMLWDWLNRQGYSTEASAEPDMKVEDLAALKAELVDKYHAQIKTFKKQDKVLGVAYILDINYDELEIWFKVDGSVNCKSSRGFANISKHSQLIKWIEARAKYIKQEQTNTNPTTNAEPQVQQINQNTQIKSNRQTSVKPKTTKLDLSGIF